MILWNNTIKQSGKLNVYLGSLAGKWAHVFREVLHEFNVLSSAHKLGVKVVESKRPPEDESGAEVGVQAVASTIKVAWGGESKSEDFDGNRLHGRTLLFSREQQLERAFIFVPGTPQVSLPGGFRAAGPGIMKVIGVHELFHACGLENDDHTRDDLFQGTPRVNAGDTAAGDKILIGVGPKSMPPLYLSGATAKSIKDLWTR
jgi:hypothetical protein